MQTKTSKTYSKATIPTKDGLFDFYVWPASFGAEPVAIATVNLDVTKPVLVRVHSECLTGDNFGSLKCDCGPQKEAALKSIQASGNGVFIYHRQEGRGIGLHEKMKAYALQEKGYDTYAANVALGHAPDAREYSSVAKLLTELGVNKVKLLTNNPHKISSLVDLGVNIIERVPLVMTPNVHNENYLETKRSRFGHYLGVQEKPYIGVSGVKTVRDAENVTQALEANPGKSARSIYVGITATRESFTEPNKLNVINEIIRNVSKSGKCIPVLHYSFQGSQAPLDDLILIQSSLSGITYLQINDLAHDHERVLNQASKYYNLIIPITTKNIAITQSDWLPDLVRARHTWILIDPSEGRGIAGASDFYRGMLAWCRRNGIEKVAVAGGFGPESRVRLEEISKFSHVSLSVDAESNIKVKNIISKTKVSDYLRVLSNWY